MWTLQVALWSINKRSRNGTSGTATILAIMSDSRTASQHRPIARYRPSASSRSYAGRLGHRNAATTLNVYVHFLEQSDRAAADVMGGLIADEP
jgi:hypothetical protein